MTVLLALLAGHWLASLLMQTLFLHRYAAHGMFTLSRPWERALTVLTFLAQGPSNLNPRAYAILHRMHHAWSDGERDPHSPRHSSGPLQMMWRTKRIYHALLTRRAEPPPGMGRDLPEWPAFDRLADAWPVRVGFGALYAAAYLAWAPSPWWFLLLPAHWLIGPIHGAIVNWCGHRYGAVRFPETGDDSRNTLRRDFLMLGELFQNNHHRFPNRPDFAVGPGEVDPTWPLIRLLDRLGVLRLTPRARAALGDSATGPRPVGAGSVVQQEALASPLEGRDLGRPLGDQAPR